MTETQFKHKMWGAESNYCHYNYEYERGQVAQAFDKEVIQELRKRVNYWKKKIKRLKR